jgi:hypothetical protein
MSALSDVRLRYILPRTDSWRCGGTFDYKCTSIDRSAASTSPIPS